MSYAAIEVDTNRWVTPRAEPRRMVEFGLKLSGSGPHQSKTMMLPDFAMVMEASAGDLSRARSLVVEENVLDKRTRSTRVFTWDYLSALYGIHAMPPITRCLVALWPMDPAGRPLLALLCALARDPLLRDTADLVLRTPIGTPAKTSSFVDEVERKHPHRFSPIMLRSLAQRCAATWTQSGHLRGPVKRLRVRAAPTPQVAAFAALIASACGFGGPALLDSLWLAVLDVSRGQALDLLRQAEAQGLARVRSAGDVLEIAVRQQMSHALKVPELAHV